MINQPRLEWSVRPRFKEWREARNMTQQQVAAMLGVTQPTVMKWETEQRKTSLAVITRYANAFDEHPLQFILLEMRAALTAQPAEGEK
jgi:transcriptional regulator with XRE-family HTH domain